jgi:hypothetical protein
MFNAILSSDSKVHDDFYNSEVVHYRQEFAGDISSFFSSVGNVVKNITASWEGVKFPSGTDLFNQIRTFTGTAEYNMSKTHFLTLSDVVVPCPTGFDKDFLGYIAVLEKARAQLFGNAEKAASEFYILITTFVNDRSARMEIKNFNREIAKLRGEREAMEKAFDHFFTTGNNQRQAFGRLFETKKDVSTALHSAASLLREVQKEDPRKHEARSKEIAKRLEMVIEIYRNSDSAAQKQHRLAFLAISEYGLEVARQFEFVAKYMARVEIASTSAKNIAERIANMA